ncbi:hypothetical protein STEG23_003718, partial [Scotinomys teguina]
YLTDSSMKQESRSAVLPYFGKVQQSLSRVSCMSSLHSTLSAVKCKSSFLLIDYRYNFPTNILVHSLSARSLHWTFAPCHNRYEFI